MEQKIREIENHYKQEANKKILQVTNEKRRVEALKDEIKEYQQKYQKDIETISKEKEILEQTNKQFVSKNKQIQQKLKQKAAMCQELQTKYAQEQILRKRFHNELIDTKGRVRVYCRIRPLSTKEIESGEKDEIEAIDQTRIRLKQTNGITDYDAVYGPQSTQEEIFEDTRMLVQSVIDGYNVSILAYGATGSGKTHTIQGTEENPGICPRALTELFRLMNEQEKDGRYSFRIEATMFEIYMNKLSDLFLSKYEAESGKKATDTQLKVYNHEGVTFVKGCITMKLEDEKSAFEAYDEGIRSRKVAATRYNEHSSRSHLIFTVVVHTTNNETGDCSVGKLTLVDLAGSEKLKDEENKVRMNEGIAVNQGLSALRNCIHKINQSKDGNSSADCYRDHILTKLLKDSIGGTAKTLVMININPATSMLEQSKSSLLWGSEIRKIENTPNQKVVNDKLKNERDQLLKENLELKMKLGEGKSNSTLNITKTTLATQF